MRAPRSTFISNVVLVSTWGGRVRGLVWTQKYLYFQCGPGVYVGWEGTWIGVDPCMWAWPVRLDVRLCQRIGEYVYERNYKCICECKRAYVWERDNEGDL